MRPRSSLPRLLALALLLIGSGRALAQESWSAKAIDAKPPEAISAEIRALLAEGGYEATNADGQPFVRFWMRREIPATSAPDGPAGAVQFPYLAEGQLLGIVEYLEEGYDYRDQSILPGLYTVRYLLQPVNGDHLGVSPYRDYGLLVPADLDPKPEPLERKPLERESTEASGTNHPAVLLMTTAPSESKSPSIAHNEEKGLTGLVVPLALKVGDSAEATSTVVQFIVDGAAAL